MFLLALTGDGRPHTDRIDAVPKVVSYAPALAVSPVNSSENSYLKITSRENAGIRRWGLARTAVMPPGAAASHPPGT